MARLLVVNGTSYVQKFVTKTAGVVIMQHRIKRWWKIPAVWLICFAILFGKDVASIDMERPFDLYTLLEIFDTSGQARVVYPQILPVLTSMLQVGLRSLTRCQAGCSPPSMENNNDEGEFSHAKGQMPQSQGVLSQLGQSLT